MAFDARVSVRVIITDRKRRKIGPRAVESEIERGRETTMWTSLALATFGVFLITDTASGRRFYPPPKIDRNCECGKSGEGISNRIVGGVTTMPHLFPWIVAIFQEGLLHCGGALINDRYVLTAGHCVRWSNKRSIAVGLGMHDIMDPNVGYTVPVERFILHEEFESDFLHDTNDISLMKLQYPVKFSETVSPLCLPMKGSDYSGHKVTVAGWGRVKNDGDTSRYLRKAELRVMPYAMCRNTTFGEHLTESMMCGFADGTDACQGDSGGPLLFERQNGYYETIGIVSWGIGCAQPNTPGVYVKLTDYLNWIKANTQDGIYCMDR